MKIYTKKGDHGQTSLFGGGPYPKDHLRIQAYGSVDELNAMLGVALVQLSEPALQDILLEIQKQLFILGSELAALHPTEAMQQGYLQLKHIQTLETQIDEWESELTPLKQFILPGGTPTGAALHVARTVCRRAERQVVTLSQQETLRDEVLQYLNRLSDWLFVLARLVNHRSGVSDVLWEGILK